jgi:hypothetical protein
VGKLAKILRANSILIILSIGFISCEELTATEANPASKTPLPLPPTRVSVAGATPLPTWTPQGPSVTPQPGRLREPMSGSVQQGQAYIFSLYTHCGIDQYVDFDGSFWDAADPSLRAFGNAPAGIGNPAQLGKMTLIETNRARFEYEGGAYDFVRHDGPKLIRICY